MRGKVNKKSHDYKDIYSAQEGSILADFLKIKQLVDEHYKLTGKKRGR